MSLYGTTHTDCAEDTRLYSYTHRSVTIYVYTICLSSLHFLCLMQFEDTTTFKIQTALPVLSMSTSFYLLLVFLRCNQPWQSSSSSALPIMPSYRETFGTGTRINAQPNFDDVTQRVRSTNTLVVTLKFLGKNDRITNMCSIMYAYFHPTTRKEYPDKSTFGKKQAPFWYKCNCCIKQPTVHESIYCEAVTANLDHS
jgi:hypothetical protein